MRKTKTWLKLATVLIVAGLVIFVGTMTACSWDFGKLDTRKYVTNEYVFMPEEISDITIETGDVDVEFISAQDGKCEVACYEGEREKHVVTAENGMLSIKMVSEKKWYDYVGIQVSKAKITVALPSGEYGNLRVEGHTGDLEMPKDFQFKGVDVKLSTGDVEWFANASENVNIKTSTGDVEYGASAMGKVSITASTGDIEVENSVVGGLELTVTTGKIEAENVECEGDFSVQVSTGKSYLTAVYCQNFTSNGNTGNLSMEKVIATGKFSIERSTGDVRFNGCDAAEIVVETDTGDVKGSLLSGKIFVYKTSTGKVSLPQDENGGRFDVTTSTGDITITIG